MTVHVVAQPVDQSTSHSIGFLRMSADAARTFLAALRDGRCPIVATGDEDGTIEVVYEITDRVSAFSVRKIGEQHVLHRLPMDSIFDIGTLTNNLFANLGV